jgi:hypothetical protein
MPLETVTDTGADVATLPDVSRAIAVNVCTPSGTLVVSQEQRAAEGQRRVSANAVFS